MPRFLLGLCALFTLNLHADQVRISDHPSHEVRLIMTAESATSENDCVKRLIEGLLARSKYPDLKVGSVEPPWMSTTWYFKASEEVAEFKGTLVPVIALTVNSKGVYDGYSCTVTIPRCDAWAHPEVERMFRLKDPQGGLVTSAVDLFCPDIK